MTEVDARADAVYDDNDDVDDDDDDDVGGESDGDEEEDGVVGVAFNNNVHVDQDGLGEDRYTVVSCDHADYCLFHDSD